MATVKKVKELLVVTPNKSGMLAEVTSAIADSGVNIIAMSAYGAGAKANFMIVTEDNQKAMNALRAKKFDVKEKEVVSVSLSNKIGAAKEMAEKLAKAGIDLDYCYGSTGNGQEALFLFSTKDVAKSLDILK